MPTAVCPDCNGTGWKIVEHDDMSGAVRCGCAIAEHKEGIEERSGIPLLYEQKDFARFDIHRGSLGDSRLGDIFRQVRAYVREYPDPQRPGLLLMGDHGTGKTHLAVAALRGLIDRGFEGVFFDYQNLLERIQQSYDPQSNSADREAYRTALDAEVLLIDDLGNRRVSDWVEDTVTSIITHRCNNRKATIATTNLIDGDAGDETYDRTGSGVVSYKTTLTERIGPRARSRLFEMCRVVKMPAVRDYRVEKRQQL